MGASPQSTYRFQVTPGRGLAAVADELDRVAGLGVSHIYLSPLLASVPGSTHGYDIIDHTRVDDELGGDLALRELQRLAAARGLGIVVDIVPNHMAIPVPQYLNATLWSVLREGPDSPFANWFDVDWSAHRPLLLPILGDRIDACLDAGQLRLASDGPEGSLVVRYEDHVFPVRAGTELLDLDDLLEAQHYRLAYWRLADEELNYRRFFDVDTLVGIRVEDRAVFDATHELIGSLMREGVIDGLRIDHPDGLADPRAYLRELRELTGGSWVVVEKILEDDEDLPSDWECAGTTGYEASARIGGVFVDPAAEVVLTQAFAETVGDDRTWEVVAADSRREVLGGLLATEVERLSVLAYDICQEHLRLRDHSKRGLSEALVELLASVPVYRVYVYVDEPASDEAVTMMSTVAAACIERIPGRESEFELLRDLALGRHGRSPLKDQFIRRFQQTCGPAMAKGVEDTAIYRWFPLTSLAEVGSRPDEFGISDDAFHDWALRRSLTWPAALTAASTHDSKRSEDVRARLAVLSEIPGEWLATARAWSARIGPFTPGDEDPDPRLEWLLWQTLVGAWPIDATRLGGYLIKAAREAKIRTSWTAPDEAYEAAVRSYVDSVLADQTLMASVAQTVERLARGFVTNVLGQRALQALLPGVPDIYQGCEIVNLRLTDPDNRLEPDASVLQAVVDRAVDTVDPWTDLDAAKARLTTIALGLRRDRPSLLTGSHDYAAVSADGPAAHHGLGFLRADLCVLVSRWALRLDSSGGWRGTTLLVPAGTWRDALTGTRFASTGQLEAAAVFERWPTAVLVRDDQ